MGKKLRFSLKTQHRGSLRLLKSAPKPLKKKPALRGITIWFQKNVMAGKKIVWVENGLNIGNRASGLGLNIKDVDVLLSALKKLEIIQY